jgi:hypothetical protein
MIPMIAMTTIAPTTIQSHGTVLVVVVVVVDESGFVAVVEDPALALGAVAAAPPVVEPFVAGPVVVDVVDEPAAVPAVCAYVIAGAMARNSARSMRLSRKIGRMWFLPLNQFNVEAPCPGKQVLKTSSLGT